MTNNTLVLHSTEANQDGRYADLRAKIHSAQNGLDPNLVTNWNGTGLTSTTARTRNLATGFDLVSLGLIRNSDLDITTGIPGSAYTSFGGEPVGPHDLLLKYTYIGDANLNGVVSFDDYVGMDNAFFGLIPNLGWATGDVNFDNAINFDDYSKVDQAFFFQGVPLGVGQARACRCARRKVGRVRRGPRVHRLFPSPGVYAWVRVAINFHFRRAPSGAQCTARFDWQFGPHRFQRTRKANPSLISPVPGTPTPSPTRAWLLRGVHQRTTSGTPRSSTSSAKRVRCIPNH